jgi:hypothetical protein
MNGIHSLPKSHKVIAIPAVSANKVAIEKGYLVDVV